MVKGERKGHRQAGFRVGLDSYVDRDVLTMGESAPGFKELDAWLRPCCARENPHRLKRCTPAFSAEVLLENRLLKKSVLADGESDT